MKHTDAWPIWDGAIPLSGRRIRLDYPNGRAYAVGVARAATNGYELEGTGIWFHHSSTRVRVAPEGER